MTKHICKLVGYQITKGSTESVSTDKIDIDCNTLYTVANSHPQLQTDIKFVVYKQNSYGSEGAHNFDFM